MRNSAISTSLLLVGAESGSRELILHSSKLKVKDEMQTFGDLTEPFDWKMTWLTDRPTSVITESTVCDAAEQSSAGLEVASIQRVKKKTTFINLTVGKFEETVCVLIYL